MEYKNRIPELTGSQKVDVENTVMIVSQLLKEVMNRVGLNNIIKSEVKVEDTPFILTFEKNGSFTDYKITEAWEDGYAKGLADANEDALFFSGDEFID